MAFVNNTVPTINALRNVNGAGGRNKFFVTSYSTLNDNGGGEFYWDSLSTEDDNDGTIIQATEVTTGRWKRRFSGATHASWFGVKANGKKLTDGYVQAGSTTFTSASANFTAADVGKSILLRTANHLAAGTVSVTPGSQYVIGSGVNFPVDIPTVAAASPPAQPASGGCIYIDGNYYSVNFIVDATTLLLVQIPTVTATSKPWYTETQIATTITGFISSTQVTIGTAATITEHNVKTFYATDDTSALDIAIQAAMAGSKQLILPKGFIGHSANLHYTGFESLSIDGAGATKTTIVDLRKASIEYSFPPANSAYGALSFRNGGSLNCSRFGYDGSVPVLGMIHSTGGVVNASGSRLFFYLEGCNNSSFKEMGADGYGSRDEYIYCGGIDDNVLFEHCDFPTPNNASINIGSGLGLDGNPATNGARITHCNVGGGILCGCASLEIDHCNVNGAISPYGGQLIVVDCMNRASIHDNICRDVYDPATGSGIIGIFGTNRTDAIINIKDNIIYNCTGLFHAPGGGEGIIDLNNFGGTAFISGNVIDRCISGIADQGTFIHIRGASTGKINIGPNVFRGRAGSNMAIGIFIASNIPAGNVYIDDGITYGESITTRLSLNNSGGIVKSDHSVTVSSTGTTTLPVSANDVLVTANGSVTLTLPSPAKLSGRYITIKNNTTQTGITTINSVDGYIDHLKSTSILGLNARKFFSDGVNWKISGGSGDFAGPLHGELFGIKADGRVITDGVLSAGTNTFTSSTAAFTSVDHAKRILVRMPSHPSTNPVTLTSGNNVITGTGLDVDFGNLLGSGVPITGGGIVFLRNDASVGTYRAVRGSDGYNASLYTEQPVVGAATSKTLYLETQAECYVNYVSSTQITLWADLGFTTPINAIFSETSVPAFMATDDSNAVENFINKAIAVGGPEAVLPQGKIGIYRNLKFANATNLTIRGHGRDLTVLCDLRKGSSERSSAVVEAANDHGILSFYGGNNIHLWDMSYDANLHTVGMAHSTGGVTNASGGRIGFFMRNVNNPGFHRLGSMGGVGGFGARDEHIYHDTNCTNAIIEDCVLGDATHPTNGPSFNPVSGDGVRIINNIATSHFSALECSCDSPIITGNHFSNYSVYPIGAEPCIISARGRIIFCHNEIRDTDTTASGVGAVTFDDFGNGYHCTLICSDNLFSNLHGLYGTGDGTNKAGVINLFDFHGTAYVTNNVGDNIRSRVDYKNGRFIRISGPNTTGKIYVGDNTFNPNPTSGPHYMGIGLSVKSDVPKFSVTVLPGNNFNGCVTPFDLQSAIDISRDVDGLKLAQYLEDANQTIQIGDYTDTFTANAGTDVCTSAGTLLLINGNEITLTSSNQPPTLPAGITINTTYYVRDVSGNTFKLAAVRGGAAIDITDTGTGTHTFTRAGGNRFIMPENVQTTNRTVTIGTGGAPIIGQVLRIERRDATANTLAIVNGGPGAGTLFTFAASSPGITDFWWNGTNWYLPTASNATTGAVGVIQLAADLGGTATAPNVIRLTGSSNVVTLPSTNLLTWDSSGPSIGARPGTATDIALKVNTANSNIVLFDNSNIIGFFNYNSGSPYFQQFNGAGFQLLATGGDLILNASTAAKNVQFWAANTLRLTLSNSALTFATGVTAPTFTQADNTTNSATAADLTIQSQSATGTTSTGGSLTLASGTGTSTHGVINLKLGTNPIGTFSYGGSNTAYLVPSGAASFNIVANQGTGQYIIINVAGTTPTGLFLDADTIGIRQGNAGNKGVWTNTGLRIGDGTSPTDKLELSSGNMSWDKTVSTPKIYQKDNTTNSATATSLTLQAQNATGTTSNGGGLSLTSGTGTTVGGDLTLNNQSGSTIFKSGSNTIFNINYNAGSPYLQFGSAASSCQILANAGTNQTLNIIVAGTTPNALGLYCDTITLGASNTTQRGQLTSSGLTLTNDLRVNGNSGFNNTAPIAKPTVTGSRGSNAALASLLTALANYGLVVDSSS